MMRLSMPFEQLCENENVTKMITDQFNNGLVTDIQSVGNW